MMRTSLDVALGKPSPVPPEVTVLAGKLSEGLDQADRLLEGLLLLAHAQQGAVGEVAGAPLPASWWTPSTPSGLRSPAWHSRCRPT